MFSSFFVVAGGDGLAAFGEIVQLQWMGKLGQVGIGFVFIALREERDCPCLFVRVAFLLALLFLLVSLRWELEMVSVSRGECASASLCCFRSFHPTFSCWSNI